MSDRARLASPGPPRWLTCPHATQANTRRTPGYVSSPRTRRGRPRRGTCPTRRGQARLPYPLDVPRELLDDGRTIAVGTRGPRRQRETTPQLGPVRGDLQRCKGTAEGGARRAHALGGHAARRRRRRRRRDTPALPPPGWGGFSRDTHRGVEARESPRFERQGRETKGGPGLRTPVFHAPPLGGQERPGVRGQNEESGLVPRERRPRPSPGERDITTSGTFCKSW